jgi:two-component system, NarL family, invasion response regulator UvrY
MPVHTIVVDDHAIVRRGIIQILGDHPDIRIVGEASDYGSLRALLRVQAEVDLLVMDVGLPGKDGIDILKTLRDEMPKLRVLMVSMYPEDQYAVRAFRAGAAGYLNKASAPEKLIEAVSQVIAGRKYVTPEIAQALIENLNAPEGASAHEKLSDREFQTLKLIARQATGRHRRGADAVTEDGECLSRAHPGEDGDGEQRGVDALRDQARAGGVMSQPLGCGERVQPTQLRKGRA